METSSTDDILAWIAGLREPEKRGPRCRAAAVPRLFGPGGGQERGEGARTPAGGKRSASPPPTPQDGSPAAAELAVARAARWGWRGAASEALPGGGGAGAGAAGGGGGREGKRRRDRGLRPGMWQRGAPDPPSCPAAAGAWGQRREDAGVAGEGGRHWGCDGLRSRGTRWCHR